jgi:hypothetical protein
VADVLKYAIPIASALAAANTAGIIGCTPAGDWLTMSMAINNRSLVVLNLVERWFAELTNKRIRRGVFRSVKELETAIREYIDVHNEAPKPFVWTKTADQILDSIARYARRTLTSHPPELISRTTGTGD